MKAFEGTLLVLGIFFACMTGCSQDYNFSGIVVDGQGVGIKDAKIILYPHDVKRPESGPSYKTKEDGLFKAGWCCTPGVKFLRMVVSKPGYEEDNRIVLADEEGIRIVLSVVGGRRE